LDLYADQEPLDIEQLALARCIRLQFYQKNMPTSHYGRLDATSTGWSPFPFDNKFTACYKEAGHEHLPGLLGAEVSWSSG
jgi:hypothetical protein